MQRELRALKAAAGRNGPRHTSLRQIRQQLRGTGQRPHLRRITLECFAVRLMNPLGLFRRNGFTYLARQRVNEQTAAHTDLAMNTPDGKMNPAFLQCLTPREYVLVNAVDERAVEIKQVRLS